MSTRITYKALSTERHQLLLQLDTSHLLAFLACMQHAHGPSVLKTVAKAIGGEHAELQATRLLGSLTMSIADLTEQIVEQHKPHHHD